VGYHSRSCPGILGAITLQKKSNNPAARIAYYFDIAAGKSVGGILTTMLFTAERMGNPFSQVSNHGD
jgi:patatin-like phospholipase/acyl hydrolase